MTESARSTLRSAALTDSVAGMLAYLTIIPAIVFLIVEPYRSNRSVRFHAWQCILLTAAWCAVEIVLGVAVLLAPSLALPLGTIDSLFTLATLIVWIMLMIKTINNERYRLPFIGDMAQRQANR